ncbi:Vacuolar sorting 38 and autophagy-related subunit 14 [Teratosphaeria destructans]|uniref:Autophagy-related protein 14 n=1 Tax=Teratosphaeria destructans TaxID=418781 RepID=A0A9W7SPQ8_9PEZI|nr:Vacuolar sorting 38 and autophagy-related subunit 14 [Teratosphaeria destructans]
MDCCICEKPLGGSRAALCAGCAQVTLYERRIQQASLLLNREKHHTHVEAVLRPGNDGIIAALSEEADWDDVHAAVTAGVKVQSVVKAQEEREAVEARIDDIAAKAEELRQKIEEYRLSVKRQEAIHAQRRQELADETKELEKLKPRILDPLQSTTRKSAQRLEKLHVRTVDARTVLCQEAARLSCLRKRKTRDGMSQYWIGGVRIPDLRELNGKVDMGTTPQGDTLAQPHEVVTAAMTNVCRLLGTCCHYLSIRLPSEIVLPTHDFPHAMILPEKSSYKVDSAAYQDLSSSMSSPQPSASKYIARRKMPSVRPRPLHLDKPLHELYKHDNKTFMLYVEGVMLLAWDVAWLCKSQGIDSINSFDDVCSIGRNLHQLLVASEQQTRPVPTRAPSTAPRDRATTAPSASTAHLGLMSHGSATNSLAGHAGLARFDRWRLLSSSRLVDKLRGYLTNEISGAEWDVISGGEWDEEEEHDRAVLVGGAPHAGPTMSVMTFRPSDDVDDQMSDGKRNKKQSGWMKVRGRAGDG